ncbi:MAG: DUF5103 domain-containing protein, partial [Muribaculaceae bacterium]|nr:DUF5103 domain-containing protein [Muribaculaceae bacterium]
MVNRLLSLLLFCTYATVFFQSMAYESIDTRTHSEDAYIRTLRTRIGGNDMVAPIIPLDAPDDLLEISFDELTDEYRQLRYEIIHCDSNWRPSKLITEQEYITGASFNQADIEDYSYSQAGLSSRYVHYSISFPNQDLRPAISGNYIMRIFPYDNPDKTLAVIRFMVSEQATPISAKINTVTDIEYNESHQQLEFNVNVELAHPE